MPVIGNKKESLSWNDFDDYAECHNAIHKIFMKDGHFCEIVHIFLKKSKCKHLIGLKLRLKKCNVPLEGKQIPLGQKRKRRRPKLAK